MNLGITVNEQTEECNGRYQKIVQQKLTRSNSPTFCKRKLELDSIMSSPKLDSEGECISLWVYWELKISIFEFYHLNGGMNENENLLLLI